MFKLVTATACILVMSFAEARGQQTERLHEDRVQFTCEPHLPLLIRWSSLTNRDGWSNPPTLTPVTRAVLGRNLQGEVLLECHYTYRALKRPPRGYTCEAQDENGFLCTQRTRRRDFRN